MSEQKTTLQLGDVRNTPWSGLPILDLRGWQMPPGMINYIECVQKVQNAPKPKMFKGQSKKPCLFKSPEKRLM